MQPEEYHAEYQYCDCNIEHLIKISKNRDNAVLLEYLIYLCNCSNLNRQQGQYCCDRTLTQLQLDLTMDVRKIKLLSQALIELGLVQREMIKRCRTYRWTINLDQLASVVTFKRKPKNRTLSATKSVVKSTAVRSIQLSDFQALD